MKRMLVCLLVALMVISTTNCFAQSYNYAFDSIRVLYGKGPLSSGLDVTLVSSQVQVDQNGRVVLDQNKQPVKGDQEFTVVLEAEQGYGMWRFSKPGPFELLATGGLFCQTPWGGPMAKVNYSSHLSSTHWVVWSSGQVGNPHWGTKFMTSYQEVALDYSHWMIYAAALNYQKGQRQDLIGACGKISLSPQLQLRLNWDRDTSDARWCVKPRDMFSIGVKYMPHG
ncbi:MAG: hypothetical protein WC465_03010 [Patescibacteria group bacterium]